MSAAPEPSLSTASSVRPALAASPRLRSVARQARAPRRPGPPRLARSRSAAARALGGALVLALAGHVRAAPPADARPRAGVDAGPEQAEGPRRGGEPGRAGASAATRRAVESADSFDDPIRRALAPERGGLTADQAAERALATAPLVAQRHAELEIAAARLDQTMYRFFPQLGADFSYTRVNRVDIDFFGDGASVGALNPGLLTTGPCPFDPGQTCVLDGGGSPVAAFSPPVFELPLNNWSLKGNLSVPLSDYVLSLSSARKGAIAERESSELALAAEKLKVQTDARIAYYNWLKGLAQVAVAKDAVERTRLRLADAERLFAAGLVGRGDLLRLDALVASGEATVVEAEAFAELAATNLAILFGDPPSTRYTVGDDVLAPFAVPRELTAPVEALIEQARRDRIELRSARRRRDAIALGIKAARASYYPRLNAFAQAEYANPNQRFFPATNEWNLSWFVGAGISWTLNDTLRTKGQIREYKGNERVAESGVRALERGIAAEVASAHADLRRAQAALESNVRAARSAQAAYELVAQLYRGGQATANDLIDAEASQVNAALQEIAARIDLRVAAARLSYAIGAPDPRDRAR